MIDFNEIINSTPVVSLSIVLALFISLVACFTVSILYPNKNPIIPFKRMAKKHQVFVIILGLVLLGLFVFNILSYFNPKKYNDYLSICFLIFFLLTIVYAFILSRKSFTPLGFFISFFIILSIISAFFISFFQMKYYPIKPFKILTKNINEEPEYTIRFGDMIIIKPKGQNEIVLPLSDFVKATVKDNSTDNSTDNSSIGSKITNDNLTDNASEASDNSTTTEKAK